MAEECRIDVFILRLSSHHINDSVITTYMPHMMCETLLHAHGMRYDQVTAWLVKESASLTTRADLTVHPRYTPCTLDRPAELPGQLRWLGRITHTNQGMRTYDSFDVGSFECCQPQVTNLDQSRGAVDEYVVTLEVSMDDGRGTGVEEEEPAEDLTTPAPDHLGLGTEPTHVPVEHSLHV